MIIQRDILNDLIQLGENCKTGFEKKLVLNTIGYLVNQTLSSEDYTGYELEELLRNFDKIFDSSKESNEVYHLAICILTSILDRHSFVDLTYDHDAEITLWLLTKLGVDAVNERYDEIAKMILGSILKNCYSFDPCSNAFYEIGTSALINRRFNVATTALNHLETIVSQHEPNFDKTIVKDIVGLIAHFWYHGESSKNRALIFLDTHNTMFKPSLDVCLDFAYEHHKMSNRYDTATMIKQLQNDNLRGKLLKDITKPKRSEIEISKVESTKDDSITQ